MTRLVCVLCLILLYTAHGRAADEKPNAEKQLLNAIAKGDLPKVERIAAGLDLSKVSNLSLHVLSSPNADVVDFLREQEGLDISDLQILAIRGDAKAIKQFAESSDKAMRRSELRRGHMGLWSYTPLMLALRNGRTAAARALIEAGANVSEWSVQTLTPLAVAAERGHLEIVKDLLRAGAEIDANPNAYTALMRACIGGHPKVTELLLKSGADPNLKHDDGQTALHFAAKRGSAECIKLLLERGADVNAIACEKATPLYYAEFYKHKAAIEALRQAMDKPSKK
jgi:hypothetical protein